MAKTHHKLMTVEVNGIAMIVMHLDAVRRGAILDLDLIERNARLGIRYLEEIGKGNLPKWHDLDKCPGCGAREGKRDVHGLCDQCNIQNKVQGDKE